MRKIFIIILISIFIFPIYAQSVGNVTGLELPRYVSLKTNESNLRVGPSTNYRIIIKYVISNIPVEIVDEYKDWRKINDYNDNKGWMHKRLLKGNRFAIIKLPYKESAQIYNKPEGYVIGKIGKNNIVKVNKCLIDWCHINFNKNKGWINKLNLWGVYKKENFNLPFYQSVINQFWKINIKLSK